MTTQKLSGLDTLKELINGNISHSPMAKVIPMKLIQAELGNIVYEAKPNEEHLNLQGGIHGGFCATVLDSVTGAAAHSLLEAGTGFATIDLNIKMIRPMQAAKTYLGIGTLINAGRTIITTEGKIVDENSKIYAYATATLMILHK